MLISIHFVSNQIKAHMYKHILRYVRVFTRFYTSMCVCVQGITISNINL